jgi:hypothetical protein
MSQRGRLELLDPDKRQRVSKLLLELWDVLDLKRSRSEIVMGSRRLEVWRHQYEVLGKLLLGEDCPEGETLT